MENLLTDRFSVGRIQAFVLGLCSGSIVVVVDDRRRGRNQVLHMADVELLVENIAAVRNGFFVDALLFVFITA